MKRKLLITLLSVTSAACCAIGLAACDKSGGTVNGSNTGNHDREPDFIREDDEGGTKLDYADNGDGGYTITGIGTETKTDIVIPATIKDVKVTAIADDAFNGRTDITGVKISEGIEKIGANAFNNCTSLASVRIPDSVTEVGATAFMNCSGLQIATIGTGLTEISNGMFQASGLVTINIPDNVLSINESAFRECHNLEVVTMGMGVKTIGYQAFYNCTSIEDMRLGIGVETLGNRVFELCTGMKNIVIPDSVQTIGDSVLARCSGLESLTIPFVGKHRYRTPPAGVLVEDDVSTYAHYGWLFGAATVSNNLTETRDLFEGKSLTVTITGVSDASPISFGAFYNARGIGTIIIKGNPTVLKQSSFNSVNGDAAPINIVIPSTVTKIEDQVFWGTTLTTIFFEGSEAQYNISVAAGSLNDTFSKSKVRYYSPKEEPGYWHYVNGVPVMW